MAIETTVASSIEVLIERADHNREKGPSFVKSTMEGRLALSVRAGLASKRRGVAERINTSPLPSPQSGEGIAADRNVRAPILGFPVLDLVMIFVTGDFFERDRKFHR